MTVYTKEWRGKVRVSPTSQKNSQPGQHGSLHLQRDTQRCRLSCPGGAPNWCERISPEKHSQQVHKPLEIPSLPSPASLGYPKIPQEGRQLTYYALTVTHYIQIQSPFQIMQALNTCKTYSSTIFMSTNRELSMKLNLSMEGINFSDFMSPM